MTLLVSGGLSGSMTPVLAVGLVVIIVFGLVALLGVALERVAYRPLRKANRLAAVVSALARPSSCQNAVMLIWGAKYYVYPETMRPDTILHLFGMGIPAIRIVIIAASVLLMLALYWFINRTRLGTAIRAAAIDQGAARLMGINVDRIIALVFLIGPGLGGVAGVMVGLTYGQISFDMGFSYGLKAFTAAILGGIGNIPGAMLGGMLLGLIETLGRLSDHGLERCPFLPGAYSHSHHQAHRPPR